jgi:hypothetical protein
MQKYSLPLPVVQSQPTHTLIGSLITCCKFCVGCDCTTDKGEIYFCKILSLLKRSKVHYVFTKACHLTSLRAGRSGDRIPVGARFSAPVQTGPGAYPASYTMGTESFPGVKRPGRGVDHPPPSSAEVKERVELYLYSPSGPSWPVLG